MTSSPHLSPVNTHSFRLRPGQDLKKELQFYCQNNHIHAGCILSSVGSLTKAHMRLANADETFELMGPFEIISLNGTVSTSGSHIHISISDTDGRVWGGHLMDGCQIYTTAEIIILELTELRFQREMDGHTGYKELKIEAK